MRSFSLAVTFLLLRIAYASAEKGEHVRPSVSSPNVECYFTQVECTQGEESLRRLCTRLVDLCHDGIDCDSRMLDCFISAPADSVGGTPGKRNPVTKSSFLFMKLHPVLNIAGDSNPMNVPNRYRRIGVRLGSEFLGKRSQMEEREDEGEEELRRGRRIPTAEPLGKRHGSEMLGKRNVEMLGKRSGEFLGKRGNEFLGKRGNEFLGKRANELLGKRANEFLGKRDRLRMRACGDERGCYLKRPTRVLVQHFRVAEGTEIDNPEVVLEGRDGPPDRWLPTRTNPLYYLEKL